VRSLLGKGLVLSLPVALLASLACLPGCSDDESTAAPPDSGAPDGAAEGGTEGGKDASSEGGKDGGAPGEPLASGVRDRDGRPYVSLILVRAANRAAYNAEGVDQALTTDPPPADGGTTFGDDFQAALVMLDGLDGANSWSGGTADAGHDDAGVYPHPLANAWIAVDALLLDPNKPFSATGYLDLEANAAAHGTCGGRWFNDDALDKTMSFFVKKTLTGISDGVTAPAKPASMTFPYLAEPF
jgi:hypothetical protein